MPSVSDNELSKLSALALRKFHAPYALKLPYISANFQGIQQSDYGSFALLAHRIFRSRQRVFKAFSNRTTENYSSSPVDSSVSMALSELQVRKSFIQVLLQTPSTEIVYPRPSSNPIYGNLCSTPAAMYFSMYLFCFFNSSVWIVG